MNYIVVAGLIAVGLGSGALLGWYGSRLMSRIEALEKAAHKRGLPERAKDGLEDLMSIACDVQFQNQDVDRYITGLVTALLKSESMRAYSDSRLDQVLAIARQVRGNPHGYDPDQPNQKRDVLKDDI